jgi:N-acyl-D-aspartate/D-glutamate deacylase
MRPLRALAPILLLLACVRPGSGIPDSADAYDIIIVGGRVIDPESSVDAVRNVGIRDGVVRVITPMPIEGRMRLDASGMVVAPGFIDLHQHDHSPASLRAKALDGVTAAFEMEMGVPDVDAWYAEIAGRTPIHFGATTGHMYHRVSVLSGAPPSWDFPSGEGTSRAATPGEIDSIRARVERQLQRGALGVGMGIEYTPGATPWEVLEMFRAAARFAGAPVHVHVRGTEPPHHWMETAELFLGTVVSGAPLHIVHANSSFGRDAPRLFEMIDAARARGLDVTTEAYPYTASMTSIRAAPFDDWEKWPDERFARFVWPPTGERLTRESFGRYREKGGVVVIEGMTEERLRPALASPVAMIASDGVLEDGSAHPRLAGTYARILGRYVREQRLLTLHEAIRKMTLMPAQRLEARAPAMRNKGRLRAGADADITVFDPATVIDQATYREPLLPSRGIVHVLVGGVPVVRDGRIDTTAVPGRAVRGPVAP